MPVIDPKMVMSKVRSCSKKKFILGQCYNHANAIVNGQPYCDNCAPNIHGQIVVCQCCQCKYLANEGDDSYCDLCIEDLACLGNYRSE